MPRHEGIAHALFRVLNHFIVSTTKQATNPFTRDHPFHPKPTPTTHDYPLQYVDRNNPFTELKSKRSTQHLNRRGEKYKEGKRGPT
jgi:hypothetical protein